MLLRQQEASRQNLAATATALENPEELTKQLGLVPPNIKNATAQIGIYNNGACTATLVNRYQAGQAEKPFTISIFATAKHCEPDAPKSTDAGFIRNADQLNLPMESVTQAIFYDWDQIGSLDATLVATASEKPDGLTPLDGDVLDCPQDTDFNKPMFSLSFPAIGNNTYIPDVQNDFQFLENTSDNGKKYFTSKGDSQHGASGAMGYETGKACAIFNQDIGGHKYMFSTLENANLRTVVNQFVDKIMKKLPPISR